MSLREQQSAFAKDVAKLLVFCEQEGFEVTLGEVLRTEAQQAIYIKEGKSKTSNSMHLKKCAIDLNFFRDGNLIENAKELKEIGNYWESLDVQNRWGGSWRGLVEGGKSSFIDYPHFERQV
jgi:hypothetical protein